MKKLILLFILFGVCLPSFSQQLSEVDSLKIELKKATHDTTRCRILNEMIEAEADDNVWPKFNISLKFMAQGNLKRYPPAHPLHKVFKKYYAISLNNIGYIHSLKGDIFHALEYYYSGLAIQQDIGDKKGTATSYNNIGSIYNDQGDREKALEFYNKSYELQKEIGDKSGMAISLLNIGFNYDNNKKTQKALDYYLQSLEISKEIDDIQGQVYTMNNISITYHDFKDYDKALSYALEALKLSGQADYTEGKAFSYNCLGTIYMATGKTREALDMASKSMAIGKELGFPQNIGNAAELLSDIYEKRGDYKRALDYHKLHVQMRDSVNNEQTKKISIKKQLQSEYDKRILADSIKTVEEKKIAEVRLQGERTQRFALYGGLALVLVFAAFIFNRFRVTRKQNHIIKNQEKEAQHQRQLVEEKQKEVIDSINYAKHIQNAILAREEDIHKYFPESFLLYKPKDIVAGDFYFFETTATHVFYAAADCTGHGVPGALVSVVCANALTRCVKEFKLTDPGKILDKARELVIETFEKSGQGVKDGMDISLISLRFKAQSLKLDERSEITPHASNPLHFKPETSNIELLWSGANNPLWYFTAGEMKEIKPDKQAIGFNEKNWPFTTHKVILQPGDFIYLFTDGYADQFGGPKGKKFKYKNLEKFLLAQKEKALQEQLNLLDQNFEDWRGSLEQVDDVCVIGVKF